MCLQNDATDLILIQTKGYIKFKIFGEKLTYITKIFFSKKTLSKLVVFQIVTLFLCILLSQTVRDLVTAREGSLLNLTQNTWKKNRNK